MRGKPLSEDARRIVVLMAISHHIPVKDISAWTGIPLRSIQRIVSLYQSTRQDHGDSGGRDTRAEEVAGV